MAERDAWEVPLYQFARLLLRDEAAARATVLEVLEAGAKKRPSHIDPDRLVMLQFRDVRRRIVKNQPPATSARRDQGELPPNADAAARDVDAARLATVLHALPEPGRSAYALLLLDAMEAEWIAKLLELSPAELSDAVHGARLAVHAAISQKTEVAPQ
jgi:DNA-directed RNA polymerase specialized sigma24 family protein